MQVLSATTTVRSQRHAMWTTFDREVSVVSLLMKRSLVGSSNITQNNPPSTKMSRRRKRQSINPSSQSSKEKTTILDLRRRLIRRNEISIDELRRIRKKPGDADWDDVWQRAQDRVAWIQTAVLRVWNPDYQAGSGAAGASSFATNTFRNRPYKPLVVMDGRWWFWNIAFAMLPAALLGLYCEFIGKPDMATFYEKLHAQQHEKYLKQQQPTTTQGLQHPQIQPLQQGLASVISQQQPQQQHYDDKNALAVLRGDTMRGDQTGSSTNDDFWGYAKQRLLDAIISGASGSSKDGDDEGEQEEEGCPEEKVSSSAPLSRTFNKKDAGNNAPSASALHTPATIHQETATIKVDDNTLQALQLRLQQLERQMAQQQQQQQQQVSPPPREQEAASASPSPPLPYAASSSPTSTTTTGIRERVQQRQAEEYRERQRQQLHQRQTPSYLSVTTGLESSQEKESVMNVIYRATSQKLDQLWKSVVIQVKSGEPQSPEISDDDEEKDASTAKEDAKKAENASKTSLPVASPTNSGPTTQTVAESTKEVSKQQDDSSMVSQGASLSASITESSSTTSGNASSAQNDAPWWKVW